MKIINSIPKKDGFRMPGEFEEHDGCWMIWPSRPDVWRNGGKNAQATFVEVAKAISRFEPVTMCVNERDYENARMKLPENIRVVEISSDDAWMRDVGATFVVSDSEVRGVDWKFNCWGGLDGGAYFPWDKDLKVAQKMCGIEKVDRYVPGKFVLEGGSIHTDGDGTIITTEECLLNKNRNPDMTKDEIENHLLEYLNGEKVIWLKRGLYLDETDGHVDNLCCFAKPGVVLLSWTDDTDDPHHEIAVECLEKLENTLDAKGRKIEVVKLQIPGLSQLTEEESEGIELSSTSISRKAGERIAASYVNFYIANGGIVFPLFKDSNDEKARETLQKVFPGREIVGVYSREIVIGGGNIHCITQQQPSIKRK
jgi:agmatine deiminase